MAIEWPWFDLAPGKRRGMALPWIENMLGMGMGATEILQNLREMGMGYRMTTFFSDVRGFTGAARQKAQVMRLPDEAFIPSHFQTPSVYDRSEVLTYHGFVSYLDPETEMHKVQGWSYGSQRELTIGQLKEVMWKGLEKEYLVGVAREDAELVISGMEYIPR